MVGWDSFFLDAEVFFERMLCAVLCWMGKMSGGGGFYFNFCFGGFT